MDNDSTQAGIQIQVTPAIIAAGDKVFRSRFYNEWEMTPSDDMDQFIRTMYVAMAEASTGQRDAVRI